jgi:uncharacterized membrane protein
MLSFLKRKVVPYFNEGEQALIKQAIVEAENNTSGEIRVYVEPKCRFVNPVDRAAELFRTLKMEKTKDRNGLIVYLAFQHKQFAIFGDENIYNKLGKDGFVEQAKLLQEYLHNNQVLEGLVKTIEALGLHLKNYFPHETNDKNELPDDIVFGK